MDQYLNSQRAELLWELLANPADKDAVHAQNLQQLVNEYPQSGLLQALLTYTGEYVNLQRAAVYYNPKALYKLNKNIEGLHSVRESQVLSAGGGQMAGYFHVGEIEHEVAPHAEELPPLVPDAGYEATQQPVTDDLQVDVNAPVITGDATLADPAHEKIAAITETQPTAPSEQKAAPEHPIEEDTFDEIVSIDDINLAVQEYYASILEPQEGAHEPLQFSDIYAEALKTDYEPKPIVEANPVPAAGTPVVAASVETPYVASPEPQPIAGVKEEPVVNERKPNADDEAERLIMNNIAATDFFVFDRAFGDKKKEEGVKAEEPQPEPVAVQEPVAVETQHFVSPEPEPAASETKPVAKAVSYNNISKYHDEKMPYSFMWWLDKTRKEHSGIYQPFVEFKLDTNRKIKQAEPEPVNQPEELQQPDELQQQYIESIFQLNTVEELEGTEISEVQFDPKKKEDEIIERFIHEGPQIKPQSADKIDTENKAKKSSEDADELVTETLAQIYTDQMLYPKAIETYKKLMLKFPEKSRYFAGQIELLQKK